MAFKISEPSPILQLMGHFIEEDIYQLDTLRDDATPKLLVSTHHKSETCKKGCPLHSPSNHPLANAPQDYNNYMMLRQCPCGIWHPDRDSYRLAVEFSRDLSYDLKNSKGVPLNEIDEWRWRLQRNKRVIDYVKEHQCCKNNCCKNNSPSRKTNYRKNPLIRE